jgi:3-oxoacyl-[acyl-carrier-protein] synthase III
MSIPDRELESSPLGGIITHDGHTVTVHIYRFADTDDEWTLEVVGVDRSHIVWDETFESDLDAYEAFERAVAENGIRSFTEDASAGH